VAHVDGKSMPAQHPLLATRDHRMLEFAMVIERLR